MRGVAAVWVVASACSFEHGALSTDGGVDGSAQPDVPLGAWSEAIDVGINSGVGDDDPSLTSDLLEMYWGSRRIEGQVGAGDENIYVARRGAVGDPWGTPIPVDELDTTFAETTAKVTSDGLTIFFTSDRNGNADIYVSTRDARTDLWRTPSRVNELSTGVGDYAAFESTPKHLVLCAGPDTPSEALYQSNRPIANEPWGTPQIMAELDDPMVSECDPMEPRTGVMYYSSQLFNTDKTYDIYRVERSASTNPWGSRAKVEGISTDGHHDRDPWVSADERTIFFSSTRDGSGVDKIYMSTR